MKPLEGSEFDNKFIGRLVLDFKRNFRASYPNLETIFEYLSMVEVRENSDFLRQFPGYENLVLDFDELSSALLNFKSALEAVGGIYAICDKLTGQLYIDSAYGEGGIWKRWSEYALSGNGGNIELKKLAESYIQEEPSNPDELNSLIKNKGSEYAKNFKFSILEVSKTRVKRNDKYLLECESHYKKAFCTKGFGYNKN